MRIEFEFKPFKNRRPPTPKREPIGKVPRVSRLMALAIRFDQLIRDGVVADQADLARLGQVTRARVSQIMLLLSLAPEIQEWLLFLPSTTAGRGAVVERAIRVVATNADWTRQRTLWQGLIDPIRVRK